MFTTPLLETAIALIVALVLDARFGEPKGLYSVAPHPIRLMGGAIGVLDRLLNQGDAKRLKGVVATLLIVALGAGLGWLISFAGPFGEALLAAALLAQKNLMDCVRAVADALDRSLDAAREEVAKIVGRDPTTLDEAGVARAAIESGAENFSDAVVAPAFWLLVAGAPGILIYKLVNTADSMIGHRNPRYEEFGWAAARLDDLMNLIPARASGLLIALASLNPRAFLVMFRDARKHRSPNAGWPEAATAGALDLALAGPRVYDGRATDDAYLNTEGRAGARSDDIRAAIDLTWRAWAVLLAIVVAIAALTREFAS